MNEGDKQRETERTPVFIPCGDAFEKMDPEAYDVLQAEENPVSASDRNKE